MSTEPKGLTELFLNIKKDRIKNDFFVSKIKKNPRKMIFQKTDRKQNLFKHRSTFTHTINIDFTGSPFPIIYHILVEKERFLCV